MKLNSSTTLLILAVLIVAGAAYWFFFTGNGNQPPLTAGQGQSAAQAQFQTLVGELAPIKFDTTLFSDPRFTSLVNLSTPITPEPTGRTDPFAPLSGKP
mgnify:CR=1 FL=1